MKELFNTVVSKLRDERCYQNTIVSAYFALPGRKEAATDATRSVPAEILMMSEYLDKARKAWTHEIDDEAALHEIRKVAAMAIRCLENHGCPERKYQGITGE